MPGVLRVAGGPAADVANATSLLLGGLPLLGVAGAVEGTISQLHAPALPYSAKLLFALLLACAVYGFLLRAGRNGASQREA